MSKKFFAKHNVSKEALDPSKKNKNKHDVSALKSTTLLLQYLLRMVTFWIMFQYLSHVP